MNALHAGLVVKSLIKKALGDSKAAKQIYPLIAQDVTFPYITYRRIETAPSGSKDRYGEKDTASIVISVFTDQYEESVRIADSIVASLIRRRATVEGINIGEIRLTEANEDFEDGAYVQNLVFNIEFINRYGN